MNRKDGFKNLDLAAEKLIADRLTPSMQIAITRGDELLVNRAYGGWGGDLSIKATSKASEVEYATTDTVYDLASLTKVMSTTQAVMKLFYEGKIDLDAPVTEYLKDFGQAGKEHIRVKDLLTHTSGFAAWEPTYFYAKNPQEELEYLCRKELEYPTGEDRKYSDLGFMTLGFVVENITGMKLNEYFKKEIALPLGLEKTGYIPAGTKEKLKNFNIAPTSFGNYYERLMVDEEKYNYNCSENSDNFKNWREHLIRGEVNDGNGWYAQRGVSGHAGLFGTTEDLSVLSRLMLAGGEYGGVKLYDRKTIDTFTSLQSKFGHGYGFEINIGGKDEGYMGEYADENCFGHTGFTGTVFVADKKRDLSVIILTNKQYLGINEKGYYPGSFVLSRRILESIG